ncbi:MAG: aspartyl-phosphate phosphatase Spo0E family protein [Clostridia bacterium]|nr:aspartyl-phosphate phosphatase Spo0E family protein [Clostridia bacterium]
MNEVIEYMREELYKVIETKNADAILKISQELDELIVFYMENYICENKKSA